MPHSDFEKTGPVGAKIASPSKETAHSKVLVLCIDRDDDIGSKGGIETPIVGAVKTYEELVSKGYTAEVAVVAGKFNRGVEADEKISLEVKSILEKYHADGAVIVSDGEDDETVLPVIQSRVQVISVQRIIIRHSRSVEYSYAVLGGAFIVRAFDIDKAVGSLGRLTPTSFIRIFSVIAGVLIILAAIANGVSSIPPDMLQPNMSAFEVISNRLLVGSFAHGLITLLWIGIATILGGSVLTNWFRGSVRVVSDI